MLDRPISEFDGPVDSVRIPVVPPTGECKPFQEVLIELGTRLKLPAFVTKDGARKYRDYPDFIVNYETEPGSGIGFLAGWRGKGGEKIDARRAESATSGKCTPRTTASSTTSCRKSYQYMRNWNQGYLEWAQRNRITRYAEPILIHIYSEVLQTLPPGRAGQGLLAQAARAPAPSASRPIFDPLPFYYDTLEAQHTDKHKYPLTAITQRPMAMYHSWDSQNAWLRQIHAHNYLYVNTQTARVRGHRGRRLDLGRVAWGKVRCMAKHSEAVEPGTVWTWNAIGKAAGAWGLTPDANESQQGFLLNHLISEELPACERGDNLRVSNSDPITGQAAWYDVRVRIYKVGAGEPAADLAAVRAAQALSGPAGTQVGLELLCRGGKK